MSKGFAALRRGWRGRLLLLRFLHRSNAKAAVELIAVCTHSPRSQNLGQQTVDARRLRLLEQLQRGRHLLLVPLDQETLVRQGLKHFAHRGSRIQRDFDGCGIRVFVPDIRVRPWADGQRWSRAHLGLTNTREAQQCQCDVDAFHGALPFENPFYSSIPERGQSYFSTPPTVTSAPSYSTVASALASRSAGAFAPSRIQRTWKVRFAGMPL